MVLLLLVDGGVAVMLVVATEVNEFESVHESVNVVDDARAMVVDPVRELPALFGPQPPGETEQEILLTEASGVIDHDSVTASPSVTTAALAASVISGLYLKFCVQLSVPRPTVSTFPAFHCRRDIMDVAPVWQVKLGPASAGSG